MSEIAGQRKHPSGLKSDWYAQRSRGAVGIDVAEERKGLDLVALDGDRHLVASVGKLTVGELARKVLSEIYPTIVCIDAPSGWSISGKSRAAERELRPLGINAFSTPPDPGDHTFYRWMRVGCSIYEALSPTYSLYRGATLSGCAAEVFPEASAVLLAGELRPGGVTKSAFRRWVLSSHGVGEAVLPTVDRVDAALGALTGILALEGTYTTVGNPDEGVMLVPVRQLPGSPLERSRSPGDGGQPRTKHSAPVTGSIRCLCGCGATVRRRFLPGHDAKLKARLMRAQAEGDRGATERLRDLGWQ